MPDEFKRAQSAPAIRLYQAFRDELDRTDICERSMPYRWWDLPSPIGGIWLPYAEMLREFATELANIINDLTHCVRRLRAWGTVVGSLTNEEKLAATHEFIGALGTVALGLPYAIKLRFAFAAGHLSAPSSAESSRSPAPRSKMRRRIFAMSIVTAFRHCSSSE